MPNHIHPDKLLELCRKRYHKGGVTLSWPFMLQIVDQLRNDQTLVAKLEAVDASQDAHPHQKWADAKTALEKYKGGSQ